MSVLVDGEAAGRLTDVADRVQPGGHGGGVRVRRGLVPFLLDMKALQRIGKTTYGRLTGLSPPPACSPSVLITQTPSVLQVTRTAPVVTDGIGAARVESRR
ncbi:hypothetical protein [Streptomyces sp. NPDC086835]|uniref:hypothetical protein n=1 Tax=Streptomyces sp. NPDC086835 TaxID=3365761 RepID=UPI0037FFDCFA